MTLDVALAVVQAAMQRSMPNATLLQVLLQHCPLWPA